MSTAPEVSPDQEAADLANLKSHPGFAHLVAKFQRERDAVQTAAMTAKTDEEANKLRFAWAKLAEFDPVTLRDNAERNAKSRAKH